MRKLIVPMLLLALAAQPGTAGATHSPNGNPPIDFVRGGGIQVFPPPEGFSFGIAAKSGPEGEDPSGSVTAENPDPGPSYHGKVTCLLVTGNQAYVTVVFSQPAAVEGDTSVLHVVDTGGPGGTPDLIRFSFEPFIGEDPNRPGCFVSFFPPVDVTRGNILVHDATA